MKIEVNQSVAPFSMNEDLTRVHMYGNAVFPQRGVFSTEEFEDPELRIERGGASVMIAKGILDMAQKEGLEVFAAADNYDMSLEIAKEITDRVHAAYGININFIDRSPTDTEREDGLRSIGTFGDVPSSIWGGAFDVLNAWLTQAQLNLLNRNRELLESAGWEICTQTDRRRHGGQYYIERKDPFDQDTVVPCEVNHLLVDYSVIVARAILGQELVSRDPEYRKKFTQIAQTSRGTYSGIGTYLELFPDVYQEIVRIAEIESNKVKELGKVNRENLRRK